MKRTLYILALCLLTFVSARAQGKMTCCAKPKPAEKGQAEATEKFAMLGNDAAFVQKHENPLPFALQNGKGQRITYQTPDGKTANAYLVKAEKETDEYVFMIHEWWGLNDYIMREAERLAQELGNVNILALDLYDGKVATTQEQAGQFMQAVEEGRARAIINGALQYAGEDADVATIGWCFGGGWALQTAIMAGDKAEAAVMYYGMPEQNMERLKKLDAPVLGIFASQDQWITPKVVAAFRQNMEKAGKELTVKMYDADHAFANPSNPKYKAAFADEAHEAAVAFIKEHLD
ncbi:dienelactone hydrolase family protein [Pontibacter actiniarum]|uniref:Dienelactone hydrolase n=1 Tax=Pontibacter actiniarum TaxID=323450 RepID=A0A1X9YMU1_9BACT|nr:dienelactone hydrolase family protein [Pontibacter actiniarum]ARS34157.1 dienelactone hydrolase [Pontibacter actiniarum]